MFGNNPRVNPLESQKRLLVAESELNRTQLAGDLAALTAGLRTLTDRAKSFGSIAGRSTGRGPGSLPARQARTRRRETILATNHAQGGGNDFHPVAGLPLSESPAE